MKNALIERIERVAQTQSTKTHDMYGYRFTIENRSYDVRERDLYNVFNLVKEGEWKFNLADNGKSNPLINVTVSEIEVADLVVDKL